MLVNRVTHIIANPGSVLLLADIVKRVPIVGEQVKKFGAIRLNSSIQVINVIPYADYVEAGRRSCDLIPHEVVSLTVDGATPLRAWREFLGFTQAQVAERLGVATSVYAIQEQRARLSKSSREKIAPALGITAAQLDF